MTAADDVVFLLDCDNTLLDNDRVQDDLRQHLERAFGVANSDRYWAIFEALRAELGYADYLGALQRYRLGAMNDPRLLQMSAFLVDYPFADRLYPGALDAIAHLRACGLTVILSDGDVVFQPRKIQRSGLWDAVEGRVLIYIHKEAMLGDLERRYPARHYVMVDDKLRVLAAMKKLLGNRLTTVFPRQGHYALDPHNLAAYPPADLAIEGIGDLVSYNFPALFSLSAPSTPNRTSGTGDDMNATQQLHALGQSLWLDNITRALLTDGTLRRYIREYAVTGLTSNPTIFDQAIKSAGSYDDAIREKADEGKSGEALFFELALEDLTAAADLFRPVFDATDGVDGWVSLEVSPLLADDTAGTIKAAARLHARAQRPNLFIKIPGTRAGIPAIEESIFAGVPINVTLLFSREHYVAAAAAYMRGIERRIAAGRDPRVASVASIFVSRWDVAVKDRVQEEFHNRLGIAIAMRTYKAYRDLLASQRWQKLAAAGARPQRLLWASTGTKDPAAAPTLYIDALAAPDTINTMPEKTLLAFAEHGNVKNVLPVDEGYAEAVVAEFTREGVDDEALAADLQREGTAAFAKSWRDLMSRIAAKSDVLTKATQA
jgi:transaldolase